MVKAFRIDVGEFEGLGCAFEELAFEGGGEEGGLGADEVAVDFVGGFGGADEDGGHGGAGFELCSVFILS